MPGKDTSKKDNERTAKAIFGPGTPIAEAAIDLLKKLGADAKSQQAAE